MEETNLIVEQENLVPIYDCMEGDHFVRTYYVNDPGGTPRQCHGEGIVLWVGWPTLINGPYGEYNANVREASLEAGLLGFQIIVPSLLLLLMVNAPLILVRIET